MLGAHLLERPVFSPQYNSTDTHLPICRRPKKKRLQPPSIHVFYTHRNFAFAPLLFQTRLSKSHTFFFAHIHTSPSAHIQTTTHLAVPNQEIAIELANGEPGEFLPVEGRRSVSKRSVIQCFPFGFDRFHFSFCTM